MSYENIRKNIVTLMEANRYEVHELERRAGLKKNNIYNIIKGLSKKPSAEILYSIAIVFGVSIEDLMRDNITSPKYLDNTELELMASTVKAVTDEIKKLKLNVTEVDIVNITQESLAYCLANKMRKLDKKFINWVLVQKYGHRTTIKQQTNKA